MNMIAMVDVLSVALNWCDDYALCPKNYTLCRKNASGL